MNNGNNGLEALLADSTKVFEPKDFMLQIKTVKEIEVMVAEC